MERKSIILDAWRDGIRPSAHLSPSEWVSGRVRVMDGLSPEYDISSAPWFRGPMDALADPSVTEIIVYAPIGTGKTVSMLEAGLAWCIAEDPGPTLLIWHTDPDLEEWAETRLDYALSNTPETAKLYPRGRSKSGKMKILFPHMPLFMTGANMSGLQAKSIRRIFCDEVWRWRPGMLREAFGRLHDRWNRQAILVSQGGVEDDDMDRRAKEANLHQFCFTCPKCARRQPWKQDFLRYDKVITDDGTLDRLASANTARYVCANPECDWQVSDDVTVRRQLAEKAEYELVSSGVPGRVAFRYNVLANWRVPLATVAMEWISANEDKKKGSIELLRQYIQKRLAENWTEEKFEEATIMQSSGYLLADYMDGREWPGESHRNMTIDVQMDHYWARIRAVKPDGSSRLLWCSKVNTKEMLREIQQRFNVPDRLVFIDSGHDAAKVYDICAEYDWTALKGEKDKEFRHPGRNNGEPIYKMYSPIQWTISPKYQTRLRVIFFSATRVKDVLDRLRRGMGVDFEIGDDTPKEWHEQMNGERKKEVINGTTKQVDYIWQRIGKRDNHLWDCEVMGLVPMMIFGLLGGE